MARLRAARGLRTGVKGLKRTRSNSMARAKTPWSMAIVLRMEEGAHPRVLEVGAKAGNHAWGDPAHLEVAETCERMAVPQGDVDFECRTLEVARGVVAPPLPNEFGERLPAGVEARELAAAAQQAQLGLEVERVALRVEGRGTLRAVGREPAHAIDPVLRAVARTARADFDAGPGVGRFSVHHPERPMPSSRANLPLLAAALAPRLVEPPAGAGATTGAGDAVAGARLSSGTTRRVAWSEAWARPCCPRSTPARRRGESDRRLHAQGGGPGGGRRPPHGRPSSCTPGTPWRPGQR